MTTKTACSRCRSAAPGLESAPLPGRIGERIRDQVCPACFREWMGMQVKIINEYRLSPASPEHFEFVLAQMKAFLNLGEEEGGERA